MGARFQSYKIIRYREQVDMENFEIENMEKDYEIVREGYRAKIIPLVNPTHTKDRYGGIQFLDKRKVYGVKSFAGMKQGDYIFLEDSYDPATGKYLKGYRIINEPRVGINYCVFQVEGI